jgi:hypothetical protein
VKNLRNRTSHLCRVRCKLSAGGWLSLTPLWGRQDIAMMPPNQHSNHVAANGLRDSPGPLVTALRRSNKQKGDGPLMGAIKLPSSLRLNHDQSR